jgi:cytochrome c-type biogenesis protein CcmE
VSGSQKKLLIGGVVLIAAVAYLGVSGVKAGSAYYVDVDKFVTDPSCQAGTVRLHGKVAQEDLAIDPSGTKASFRLDGNSHSLRVTYSGALPDLFKAGCEVVVLGRSDGKGSFQAEQVLTKCASKYAPQGQDSGSSRRPQ